MDTVFDSLPSDDIEILGQIQDKLQNSPAVDALAEKYAQAMIQGIASGKEFDEIHVDISNELVQIASTALTEIKKQIPLSDGMEKKLITASLFYPIQHLPSRRSILMQREFMMVSVTASEDLSTYTDSDLTVYDPFYCTSVYRYGHCLHSHNSPDRCEIQLSHNFCTIWYSLLLFSKCRRKYARCKGSATAFLGRTVFLDPSMGYAMLIVAILGAAFLFLCLTIRIKREEKKLTQL